VDGIAIWYSPEVLAHARPIIVCVKRPGIFFSLAVKEIWL